MGIFTVETFLSVYNKSGCDFSIFSILGHVIAIRAKKAKFQFQALRSPKWKKEEKNWPTLLGCLDCWQMAAIGWVIKGGPNSQLTPPIQRSLPNGQFMTFGPYYIFYGSLQTCILEHLLNSQCKK